MKNVFKKAHEITKNIIRKGDSYRETFRLALIFVYSQIKKGVNKMVELKGTEKQVKWAMDIRNNIISVMENARDKKVESIVGDKVKKSGEVLTESKRRNTHIKRFENALNVIKNETSSEYFIKNRGCVENSLQMHIFLTESKNEELKRIASYFQNFTKAL